MKQELPACPVEITMGLIDDKWKILIIRDLLTNNLRDMEKSGLVHREVFAEVPPRVEYSLTDTGWSLKPVLDSMVQWVNNYHHLMIHPTLFLLLHLNLLQFLFFLFGFS